MHVGPENKQLQIAHTALLGRVAQRAGKEGLQIMLDLSKVRKFILEI